MSELGDTCCGKLLTANRTSPGERSALESKKTKGFGNMKSTLKSHMEMQSSEFPQLCFGLAYVQDFLIMSFWNGNVYPLMLEVCDLPFDFDFTRGYS